MSPECDSLDAVKVLGAVSMLQWQWTLAQGRLVTGAASSKCYCRLAVRLPRAGEEEVGRRVEWGGGRVAQEGYGNGCKVCSAVQSLQCKPVPGLQCSGPVK